MASMMSLARGSYPQLISGGYSVDVDFGTSHVVIQASDYAIAVANNFQADESSPPTDQFVVNYTYLAFKASRRKGCE